MSEHDYWICPRCNERHPMGPCEPYSRDEMHLMMEEEGRYKGIDSAWDNCDEGFSDEKWKGIGDWQYPENRPQLNLEEIKERSDSGYLDEDPKKALAIAAIDTVQLRAEIERLQAELATARAKLGERDEERVRAWQLADSRLLRIDSLTTQLAEAQKNVPDYTPEATRRAATEAERRRCVEICNEYGKKELPWGKYSTEGWQRACKRIADAIKGAI